MKWESLYGACMGEGYWHFDFSGLIELLIHLNLNQHWIELPFTLYCVVHSNILCRFVRFSGTKTLTSFKNLPWFLFQNILSLCSVLNSDCPVFFFCLFLPSSVNLKSVLLFVAPSSWRLTLISFLDVCYCCV